MRAPVLRSRGLRAGALLATALLGTALGVGVLLSACAPQDDTTVRVLAASSLTDALTSVAGAFEEDNPALDISLSFGPSQTLATQVLQGASADVYASANATQMQRLVDEGLVGDEPRVFARNRLAIAVAAGNPAGVTGLADLADPSLVVVLTSPDVPAGDLTAQVLQRAGITVMPASLELNVRATLAKVELGEADAAVVYASDLVTASDAVQIVPIDDADNLRAEYPVAVLSGPASGARPAAEAFITFLLGPAGQALIADAGLEPVA